MKICTKCKEKYPLTMFGNRAASKDGLNTQCVNCTRAYTKAWKKNNPEKHNASNRAHYARNSDHARAKHKEWKQANVALVDTHRANYRAYKIQASPLG